MPAEGTPQGDPLSMGLYALGVQLPITSLGAASSIKQCWFAYDANQEMVGRPQHPWPRLQIFSQRHEMLDYLKGR